MVQLKALAYLRFKTLRRTGDIFAVPNEAWARFFESRGLAARLTEDDLKELRRAEKVAEKARRKLETSREPDTIRAVVDETLTG